MLRILGSADRLMEVIREELEWFVNSSVTNVALKSPPTAQTQPGRSDHSGRCGCDALSPGHVKYQPLSEYEAQRRGGKGKLPHVLKKKTLLTDCWWRTPTPYSVLLQPWSRLFDESLSVAEATRGARGRPIVNLLPLEQTNVSPRSCR